MLKTVPFLCLLSTICSTAVATEGRPYLGTSFEEMVSVLKDEKVSVQSAKISSELSKYREGVLSNYSPDPSPTIVNDAKRTLTDQDDYYDRLEKRIHGNGICFIGTWRMYNNDTPYTGYFQGGKEALFVGRVSVTTDKAQSGQKRTFGFAGKLFPTLNEKEVVKTANFFTVDYLFGSKVPAFTKTTLSNGPDLISNLFETDWSFIIRAIKMGKLFEKVNQQPAFRPVSSIAKLGLAENENFVSPKFISLSAVKDFLSKVESGPDFREELNIKNYLHGIQLLVRAGDDKNKTTPIGIIHLRESFVSYGCDRQLHFAHPRID